jgi:phage tail protein X
MSIYITKLYDRIDKICYARYGNSDNKIVEWVLDKNPGLELHPILLPMGISVNLPEPPRAIKAHPVIQQIFLWK